MRVMQAATAPVATRLGVFCDRVLELGWLMALVTAPMYFNVYSARVFEPDKATMLRSIVLVMLLAWIVKLLEQSFGAANRRETEPSRTGVWGWLRSHALLLPALVLTGDYLLATVLSTQPGISFWGSYQRLQGTYTYLSYLILFFILAFNLRTREQINRLVTVALVACVPISLYGIIQHYSLDPLPWGGDVTTRVASTMGNPIFISAFIIMVIPLALARLIEGIQQRVVQGVNASADVLEGAFIGAVMIGIAATTIAFSTIFKGDRGLLAGLAILLVYAGLALLIHRRHTRTGFFIAAAFTALTALTNLVALPVHGLGMNGMTLVLVGGAIFGGVATFLELKRLKTAPSGVIDRQELWHAVALGALVVVQVVSLLLFVRANAPTPQQTSANLWWGALPVVAAVVLTTALMRRRVMTQSLAVAQTWGAGIVLLMQLLVLLWSASRGPQLGFMASMVVFMLLFALRRSIHIPVRLPGSKPATFRLSLFKTGLVLTLLGAVLIVLLNIPNGPIEPFRRQVLATPYIGRITALAETDGTGRVRLLIWGGVLEMIKNPPPTGLNGAPLDGIRPLIGWGPESMYTVYNKVYPPELAYVEARNATPDRSHNGYLDWIVNAGFIGLAIYLGVIALFFRTAWKALWRAQTLWGQLLVLAGMSGVVAHMVEILVGIPIVATLTYFWTFLAIVPLIGKIDGPAEESVPLTAGVPEAVTTNGEVLVASPTMEPVHAGSSNGHASTGVAATAVRESGRKGRNARRGAQTGGNGTGRGSQAAPGGPPVTTATASPSRSAGGSMASRRNRRTERSSTHSPGWLLPGIYLGLTLLILFVLASLGSPIDSVPAALGLSFGWLVVGILVGAYALGAFPAVRTWYMGNWWIYGILTLVFAVMIFVVNLNVVSADVRYKQGDAYDKAGQWQMSIESHQQAINLQSDQDQYYLFLGRAYMELAKLTAPNDNNNPRLAPTLDNALHISPIDLQQLGRLQLMQYSQVVLERAKELNPLNTDHYANLGRFYSLYAQMIDPAKDAAARTAAFNNSIAYYEQAITLSPHSTVLVNELAQVYIQLNDLDKASATINRAIAIDPRYAPNYTTKGDIELSIVQHIMDTTKDKAQAEPHVDAALQAHLKAIDIDPTSFFDRNQVDSRIARYIEFGKTDPIVERYKAALQKDPSNVQYWSLLGYIYSRTNNMQAAIDAYKQASTLAPTDWTTLKNLAVMYQQTGKLDLAIQQAQQALRYAPQDQRKALEDYIAQLQAGKK